LVLQSNIFAILHKSSIRALFECIQSVIRLKLLSLTKTKSSTW